MPSNISKDTIHFVGGLGTRAGAALVGGGCVANLFSGNLNDYMDANGGPKKTATNLLAMNNGSGKVRLIRFGSELVANGGFDEDAEWSKGEGAFIIDGVAGLQAASGIAQDIALTAGKPYQVQITTSGNLEFLPWGSGPYQPKIIVNLGNASKVFTAPEEAVFLLTPTDVTSNNISIAGLDIEPGEGLYVDNVSVREADGTIFSGISVGTLIRVVFQDTYQSGVFEVTAVNAGYIDIELAYISDVSGVSAYAGGAFPTTQAAYTDNSTLRAAVDSNTYNRLLLDYHNISRNPTVDPFTQVYDGLWDLLEGNGDLAALVKLGNRIKCTDNKKEKDNYTNSDLPEIYIRPAGGTSEIKSTSTHVQITQTFSVLVTAGDTSIDKTFFPVKWALLNALTDATNCLNLQFVRQVILEDSTDNRNTERFPGWNTAFNIKVEMWFKIAQGD